MPSSRDNPPVLAEVQPEEAEVVVEGWLDPPVGLIN